MDRERVIEQIRKCLNLAGNNPSEAEVQAALAMAKKLMDKHDIDEAEVNVKATADQNAVNVNEVDGVRRKGNVEKMDQLIAMACATLCSCKVILLRDGSMAICRFIGFPRDIAVAQALSEQLRIVMRTMARFKYGKKWGNEHTSYSVGFAAKLLKRATEQQEARRAAPVEVTGAIVLAKDHAIARFHALHYTPRRMPTKKDGTERASRALSRFNDAAYKAGWNDGETIDLKEGS